MEAENWTFSARVSSPLSLGFHSEFCTCDSIGAAREELHLAVNWECLNEGNGIASTFTSHYAMWHKSCRDAFNRTKLERK